MRNLGTFGEKKMSLLAKGKSARRGRGGRGLRLLLLIAALLSLLLYIDARGWPVAAAMAQHQLHATAQNQLQQAAAEVIAAHAEYRDYRDLVYIEQGEDGQVLLLMPDTLTLNLLMADVVSAAQTRLDALHRQTVRIPFGAFGGLRLLQGMGPQVPVALIGGGVVEAEVADALTSVGINQSRHSIQLHLTAHLQLLSPLTDEAVEVKSTLLLAESVIVGPVPQVYLGTGGGLLGAGGGL